GGISTRPVEAGDQALLDRVGSTGKHDGKCAVAALAAKADGLSVATSIVTGRRTSSAASAGKRSSWPSAKRYSIATLRPSVKPDASNAFRNGTRIGASASGDRPLK